MPNEHFELDPTMKVLIRQNVEEARELTAQEFVSSFPSSFIDAYNAYQLQTFKKDMSSLINAPLPVAQHDDEKLLQELLTNNKSTFDEMEGEDNEFFWDEVFEDEILLQLQSIRSGKENSLEYSRAVRGRMNVVAHRLLRERGFLAQTESNAA